MIVGVFAFKDFLFLYKPLNNKKRTLLRCCLLLNGEDLLNIVCILNKNAHRKPNEERNENVMRSEALSCCKTTVQALGLLVSFN